MKYFITIIVTLFTFFGCHNDNHDTPSNSPNVYNVSGKYIAKEKSVKVQWKLFEENKCESIDVLRNNKIIATVDGNAKQFVDVNPPNGTNFYNVSENPKGDWLQPPSIAIVVWEPERISDFSCNVDNTSGNILLEWTNGQEYDNIIIICGSDTITLDGNATSYTYENNVSGKLLFEIKSTFGVHETMSTFCETDIPQIHPVELLVTEVDHDTGDITLNWENGSAYDKIEIKCGKSIIDTIDGSDTSYLYVNEIYGIFDFQLFCYSGFQMCTSEIIEESVGRLVWDEDISGVVTGYHVYIWNANDEQPTNDPENAVCSIGVMNTITLLELFNMGAMPVTGEETVDLKIALTSHDDNGNFSAFSNIVDCTWTTLLSNEVK